MVTIASCSTRAATAPTDPNAWTQLGGNCGLVTDGQAYCWGWDSEARPYPPVPLARGHTFRFVTGTRYQGCALAPDGMAFWALAPDGMAFCWGEARTRGARLPPAASCGGPWQRPCAFVPTPISSTLRFRSISIGGEYGEYACGITHEGAAYCWGRADGGRLGGAARDTTCLPHGCFGSPTRIESNVRFVAVAAGGAHACALDGDGRALCWGSSRMHQTGSITTDSCPDFDFPVPCTRNPRPVQGNRRFTHLAAGAVHSCGVTSSADAYCWGSNVMGELGTDRTLDTCQVGHMNAPCTAEPVPVAGAHRFSRIDAHQQHTCALTTAGAAWCWGAGDAGQLGQGLIEQESPYGTRTLPVRVLGDTHFVDLAASRTRNVCGRTAQGVVYCWGIRSPFGSITTPVPISPPAPGLVAFTPRAAAGVTSGATATATWADGAVRLAGSGLARCANHQFDAGVTRIGRELHVRVLADRLLGGGL